MLIKTIIRLQIGAQSATMGPPLGPTLGQFGVSAMDFVKKFNEKSINYTKGTVLTTIIHVYANRTYDIKIVGPLFSSLLKRLYHCSNFNGSLKLFRDYKLFITDYMILELSYFMKHFNSFFESFSIGANENMHFIKSIKGQIRSFGLLYLTNNFRSIVSINKKVSTL